MFTVLHLQSASTLSCSLSYSHSVSLYLALRAEFHDARYALTITIHERSTARRVYITVRGMEYTPPRRLSVRTGRNTRFFAPLVRERVHTHVVHRRASSPVWCVSPFDRLSAATTSPLRSAADTAQVEHVDLRHHSPEPKLLLVPSPRRISHGSRSSSPRIR